MALLGPVNPIQLAAGASRAVRSLSERLRADHNTLAGRQVRFAPQAMSRYYLYAAVAPSRRSSRPWDDQQVARAQRFARRFSSEQWTDGPRTADADLTCFGEEGVDGAFERVLYVHRDGLVEMLWALSYDDVDECRELNAVELASVVTALACAVASAEYEGICRAGWLTRRVRRTDWLFCVATAVPGESGQRHWDELRFPGQPPPRAVGARANMPPAGYGRETLQSLRRKSAPREVPTALVRELLAANGYHAIGALPEELASYGPCTIPADSG